MPTSIGRILTGFASLAGLALLPGCGTDNSPKIFYQKDGKPVQSRFTLQGLQGCLPRARFDEQANKLVAGNMEIDFTKQADGNLLACGMSIKGPSLPSNLPAQTRAAARMVSQGGSDGVRFTLDPAVFLEHYQPVRT